MKSKKLIVTSALLVASISLIIVSFSFGDYYAANAHDTQLTIQYDDCIPSYYHNSNCIGDGEDEKWYELVKDSVNKHYYSQDAIIKYYVSDVSQDGNISWNDISVPSQITHVKSGLIDSIKKWNNVSFYSNEQNGLITKQRIMNIVEGSASDNNLTIYPAWDIGVHAETTSVSIANVIDNNNGISHRHYNKWAIDFDITYLLAYSQYSEAILERVGAHEFGHVLGLRDIDFCENGYDMALYHHEELLMGYCHESYTFSRNISYKDLIGAAINMGLHTDNDHRWIYDANSSSMAHHKMICSICNGVKYVIMPFLYEYVNYKSCNDNHTLSSGNMFAVASYNNYDYYKCKYCRYVAPFEDIEEQNYTKTSYDAINHIVANNVTGLGYSFLEPHTFNSSHICSDCNYQGTHSHSDHYDLYSSTQHKAYCSCGHYVLESHAVDLNNTTIFHNHVYGNCIQCGALVDLGEGPIIVPSSFNNLLVSDSGSYILPNGIVMLVEEDLESYLNGTLIFHPYGEVSD